MDFNMKKVVDSMRRAATNATRGLVPGHHSPGPSTPGRAGSSSRPATPVFAVSSPPPPISPTVSPAASPTPDLGQDAPGPEPEEPQGAATADPLIVKVLTAKELATLTVTMENRPDGRAPVQHSNRAVLEVLGNLVKVRSGGEAHAHVCRDDSFRCLHTRTAYACSCCCC